MKFVQALGDSIRGGLSLWWLAPLIPLISFATEMAQHVAEIGLGMFVSEAAFKAHQMSAERLMWAVPKGIGLIAASILTIRFWAACDNGSRTWDLRDIAWKAVAINLSIGLVLSAAPMLATGKARHLLFLAVTVATLPLLPHLVGAVSGDRTTTLGQVFRTGWTASMVIGALPVLLFVPLQVIHYANHGIADAQPPAVVWALMIWDSFIVSLIATMMGTATYLGWKRWFKAA